MEELCVAVIVLAFVLALLGLSLWAGGSGDEWATACLAKGGVPYQPSESPWLCLAPGTVIP